MRHLHPPVPLTPFLCLQGLHEQPGVQPQRLLAAERRHHRIQPVSLQLRGFQVVPPPPQLEGGRPDHRDHRAGPVHARVHSHSLRPPGLRQLPGQRVSTDAKKGPATSALPPLGVRAHPWAVPLGPPTHLPMARPVPSPGSDKQPPGPLHQLHRTSWASLSVFSAAAQGGRLGGTSAFTPRAGSGCPLD